jgi:hypothetical protein
MRMISIKWIIVVLPFILNIVAPITANYTKDLLISDADNEIYIRKILGAISGVKSETCANDIRETMKGFQLRIPWAIASEFKKKYKVK